jgi:autotransporter-associated beta strand protein
MKPNKTNRILAALLSLTATAHSASLTWDGNGATAPNPNGGAGTWDVNTSLNWWDGSTNVVWPTVGGTDDDAVFANTAGTVSLATGGVTVNDLTFSTTGYIIQNDTLTVNGTTANLSTDTGVTATINSVIAGTGTVLTKTGAGTLVLGGTNTYTGKTAINAGVLSINADNKLGTAPGAAVADQLTIDGGTLKITAGGQTLSANRGITLGANGATLDTAGLGTAATTNINGIIAGTGPLTIRSDGNMTNTGGGAAGLGLKLNNGANTFTGDVTITSGLVAYANNLSFGNAANKIILNGGGLIDNNLNIPLSRPIEVLSGGGTFRLWGSVNVAWSSTLSGSGNINRTDGGTLTFTGDLSAYTGTFNNQRGVTVLNTSAANIGGNWIIDTASGGLRIDGTGTQTLAGTISGAGTLTKQGTGNVRLNPVITGNTYTGATSVTGGGTLTLAQNRAASTSAITVTGSKLALAAGSGLHEGSLTSATLNTTAVNPATAITNGTTKANSTSGWAGNQQWNYSGYIFVPGTNYVNWSFGANIDDATFLSIDGRVVINNSTWNNVDVGTINLAPGWHRIDARFQNAAGGAGPHGSSGNNWTATKGFGLDQLGLGSLDANNYTILSDPGDASFLTQDLISANNVAFNGASELNVASGATMSGIISGTGTLAINGNGSLLLLTGNSTYTGAITLNGTTVQVPLLTNGGVAGPLGQASNAATNLIIDNGGIRFTGTATTTDRNFTIADGKSATWEVAPSGSIVTLNGGSASGTGSFVKSGAGTLALNAPNLHTGPTTVKAGILVANSTLDSALTLETGSTLAGSNGSTTSTLSLLTGTTVIGVPTTAGSGNAFRATGTVTASSGVLIAGTDGIASVGTHTIDVLGYGGTSPGTANFSTSLYRAGTATVNDDAVNSKITLTYTNAQRTWNAITSTWDNQVTTAWQEGDLRFAPGDLVTFNDTGIGGTGPRTVTLNSVVSPGLVTFSPASGSVTISGTGSISGLTALVKTAAGVVTLSTANTYTGGTSITGGELQLRNSAALGSGPVTVSNGGLLSYMPTGLNVFNNVTLNGGTISGGFDPGTINNTHSGNITLNAGGGMLTTWWSDKTLTVAGVISGSGNLLVDLQRIGNNAPNVTLTGTNTYSGTTTINNGVLTIGDAAYGDTNFVPVVITGGTSGTLGTGSVINNASLVFARTTNVTIDNSITGTGNVILRNSATTTFSGSTPLSGGTLFIRANRGAGSTVIFDKTANSNAIAFNTVYIGGERKGIYGAATTLRLAASEQIADTSIVSMESGRYGQPSIFELLGANETISGLTWAGGDTKSNSTVRNNAGAGIDSTLTINTPAGTSYSFVKSADAANAILDGAAGKLSIVKNGAGTQTLQNAGHTGTTTINAGTLRIERGSLNSSQTTINNATLDIRNSTIEAPILGTTGLVTVQGGGTSNFGGGSAKKLYTVDTIIAGASTILLQTANDSISEFSNHEIGTGATLNTGNFAAWIKGVRGTGSLILNGASANLTIADGADQTFNGVVSGVGQITKEGPGTQTLGGTNTYTGGTTIFEGHLIGANSSALGVNGKLTISAGKFSYKPTTEGILNLGTGIIDLAPGSSIGGAVGNTLSGSAINSTAAATVSGAITVDVHGITGASTGTHNLLTAASGLNGAAFSLGAVYNASDFTIGSLTQTDTAVSVAVTAVTPGSVAYWKGGFSGGNNVWAISNGTTQSNWASNVSGTDTSLTPGSAAVVHFSATGATQQGAMVLGANMSIDGIVVADTSAIALNNDGHTLTLGGSGITVNSGAGAVTLSSPIALSNLQAWLNNSSNTLTIAGSINNSSSDLTVGGSGATLISGTMSGAGTLNKDGAGILTLSGSNTNTGTITVLNGTLKSGSSTAFVSSTPIVIADAAGATLDITGINTTLGSLAGGGSTGGEVTLGGATLTVGANNSTTSFAGVISGSGNFVKTGTGTLALTGTNAYTGTTTISQGTVQFGAAAPTVLGSFVMNGGDGTNARMLQPDQFAAGVVASFTSASGQWNRFDLMGKNQSLAGIQTGSLIATGGGIVQNRQNGNTTVDSFGPATLTLTGNGTYLFNGYLRNVDSGTVGTDTIALTKTGTGTQTLQGSFITYTGATTVNAGTLRLVNTSAFASPINNAAIVELEAGTGGNSTGALSGAGTYNKTGIGVFQLNGTQAITTSGQFNIIQGTLQNNNNAVNWSGNTADIDVSAGAILDLYADAIFLDVLTGSGIVQNNFGINTPAQSGATAFLERLVLGTNNGTGTFNGIIRDNSTNQTLAAGVGRGGIQLEKTGTGTQTLTGNNTYTGGTIITSGSLVLGHPTDTLANTGLVRVDGATAILSIGTNSDTVGAITLRNDGLISGTTGVLTNTGVAAESGTISAILAGTGGLTKTTTGTLTMTSINTFSGTTAVNEGIVNFNNGGGSGVIRGPLTIAAGAIVNLNNANALGTNQFQRVGNVSISGGTLHVANTGNNSVTSQGITMTGGSLTGVASSRFDLRNNGAGNTNVATNASATTSTISVTTLGMPGNNTTITTAVGTTASGIDMLISSAIVNNAGTGSAAAAGTTFTKAGSGVLGLTGTNTYSHATLVNAGTLLIDGETAAASAVSVAATGTLGGTGNAAGTIAADGVLSPGAVATIGTLRTGSVTFGATGSYTCQVNSTTLQADRLTITGNLNIDAATALNLTDLGNSNPGTNKWIIASYTGTWNNVPFASLADDSVVTIGANTYVINYNDNVSGVNAVTLTSGVSDPYVAWATANGVGAKSADDDGDGYNNLLEFATNSDAKQAGSGPRAYALMHEVDGDQALTYTVAVRKSAVFAASGAKQVATKDKVIYTVEGSDNLTAWNLVDVTEITGATATTILTALDEKITEPAIGADWEWHVFRTEGDAAVDPKNFIRLKVEEEVAP